MNIYTILDFTFTYPGRDQKAIDHISLSVEQGEFLLLCGKTGCGKTTLLRHLKPSLEPVGDAEGVILFHEKPFSSYSQREKAASIGYIMQNPETQMVSNKVWQELAFGLESLGLKNGEIRLRVAEMASFFGMNEWIEKQVWELSGGQKQMINLASILPMQPEVIIFDEPTSQLDPIAAAEFLSIVKKINQEFGITIIMSEHRLEEAMPLCDRTIVMENGKIIADGRPAAVGKQLRKQHNEMFLAMPSPMQIYGDITVGDCPVTVKEGRRWLEQHFKPALTEEKEEAVNLSEKTAEITCKEVFFRYEKDEKNVIQNLSFQVPKGTIFAVLGGNGSGKTTLLSLISSMNVPDQGEILINGKNLHSKKGKMAVSKIGILPQNPQILFVEKTLYIDLLDMVQNEGCSKEEGERRIRETAELVEISHLLDRRPYDISTGEQQRAALAKVLLRAPEILLMDEPTKGLDNYFKRKLGEILRRLHEAGTTILLTSHDIEFCARYAEICALFFEGEIISQDEPRRFFANNGFYTTAANRMCRKLFSDAVTVEDVVSRCQKQLANMQKAVISDREKGEEKA